MELYIILRPSFESLTEISNPMNTLLWTTNSYLFLLKWGSLSSGGNLSFLLSKRFLKDRQGLRGGGVGSHIKVKGINSKSLKRSPKRY